MAPRLDLRGGPAPPEASEEAQEGLKACSWTGRCPATPQLVQAGVGHRLLESVWKIEVVDFPAFIVVDDKGNDFFAELNVSSKD